MRRKSWWNSVKTYRPSCPPRSCQTDFAWRRQGPLSPAHVRALESRSLLAVITVTSLTDGTLASLAGDGKISLREAIEAARIRISRWMDRRRGPDSMSSIFSRELSGPLSLAAGELAISETLAIVGSGVDAPIIDAHGASRVFNIAAAAGDVTIRDCKWRSIGDITAGQYWIS